MSYDPKREIKRKKQFIKESVIKLVIITVCALFLAGEFSYRGDMNGVVMNLMTDMTTPKPDSPLPIPAFFMVIPIEVKDAVKFIAVGILGWLVWFVNDWSEYIRKKNMRPGEEHGSASFNLNYGQTEHDYIMSPRILKQRINEIIFFRILGIKKGNNNVRKHS